MGWGYPVKASTVSTQFIAHSAFLYFILRCHKLLIFLTIKKIHDIVYFYFQILLVIRLIRVSSRVSF